MTLTKNHIVAYQGVPGAYSEQAIFHYLGKETNTLPCRGFSDMFQAVEDGKATHALLPVENSLAGTVIPAYDQLVDHDLHLQAEYIFRVRHCLLAPEGTKLEDVERVISHYQALGQCERTLKRMRLEPVIYYDTAGAARDLAEKREPKTAAIASALAAETYGLEILVRDLEDLDFNFTRFFLLGMEEPPRSDPSKTSIILTTRHTPGALYSVMTELADEGINLTKLESRPRRNRPWHYLFYVDFEGHIDDPNVQRAMIQVLKKAAFLKVLGSYPAATMPKS